MHKRVKTWLEQIKEEKVMIILSIFLLAVALALFYLAGKYVDSTQGEPLSDIVLDNIPTFQVEWLFVYGFFLTWIILVLYAFFFRIKDFAHTLFQIGLVFLIRDFAIVLTRLRTPAEALTVQYPWIANYWNFGNDLFFSGHVAIPLLGFFIFKNSKMRYFFLGASIVMGMSALMAHLHYSIDVFAAFFIAYGSFKIGEWLFKKKIFPLIK
jgi:hypothetical protein